MITHTPLLLNDPATTEIYTLSLHDALPISVLARSRGKRRRLDDDDGDGDGGGGDVIVIDDADGDNGVGGSGTVGQDRKSTRLNSSHVEISYAVFCLKKKNA